MSEHILEFVTSGGRIGWPAPTAEGFVGLPRAPEQSGYYVLGQKCASLAEIEAVISQIRADLDAILDKARQTFTNGSTQD